MHAPAPQRFSTASLVRFALVTLIWGSTWLVIRTQLTVPVSWSVAWRFLAGSAVMFALCLASGRTPRLGWRGHGFALLIAVFQFSLNFNLVYRAEQHLTSGLVALAFALLIVPNALLSWAFLGQRVSAGFALGSGIGIVGIGLLFARDLLAPGDGTAVLLGIMLALAGVLCASVGNVLQASPAGRAQPLEGGLAWAMLYGGSLNAIVAWLLVGPPQFDTSISYMAGLGWLAVVASAGAFSLYYALIRDIGAGKAAYTGVVIPFVAMGLSTLFEGYVWSPLAGAGAVLAALGLVIALRSRG